MAFGALSAVQAGVSALPLFFGENNIFSGKARRARKGLEKTFKTSQEMADVPEDIQMVLAQRQARQNQGLGSATLGLYNREAQRGMSTALRSLQGRRSALAGIGDITRAGQDSALRLAGMEEQARRENRGLAEQTAMNVGQMRQASQLRKLDEARQFYGTQKAEANAAVSNALRGVGSAIGTSLYNDAQAGEAQSGLGLRNMFRRTIPRSTRNMRQLGISMEDVMGIK